MSCSVASDLDLHLLPFTLLGVSKLKWVKGACYENAFMIFFLFSFYAFYLSSCNCILFATTLNPCHAE